MSNVNWERLWRSSGINFVVFFIIAYVIYGDQPKVGASAVKLVSFYDGDRTRILIATVIFGGAVLFLLRFAAAIASTLRDAARRLGRGGDRLQRSAGCRLLPANHRGRRACVLDRRLRQYRGNVRAQRSRVGPWWSSSRPPRRC
jgi:hypothetical protein